ncbi:hypothetical protein MF265_16775 [Serratia marcescens]|uniref:hypothetical protein n=1 Tax=Serratia marcescens TaxID=615 RepID=UPI001EF0D7F4|nr:hypothetical protein [Serratia marcescens]ULH09618.1 hypothetical protein MF265_16775 [Serratia marcescens]
MSLELHPTPADRLRQQAIEMRRVADEMEKGLADKDGMKKALQPYLLAFLQTKHKASQATDDFIDAMAAHEMASSELITALKSVLP